MGHAYWPFFELRIRTPRIELRYPDDDVMALADVAAAGVHDPAEMPFSIPWTDVAPPRLQHNTVQHLWSRRADLREDEWHLPFAVVVDGVVVGVQEVAATDFRVRRTVVTGSWLGRAHHHRGIGREMRAAVLHLAFAELGAERAESAAFLDNPASREVSRHLGYRENGDAVFARRGERAMQQHYLLERVDWLARRRDDITVAGLEACLPWLGLAP